MLPPIFRGLLRTPDEEEADLTGLPCAEDDPKAIFRGRDTATAASFQGLFCLRDTKKPVGSLLANVDLFCGLVHWWLSTDRFCIRRAFPFRGLRRSGTAEEVSARQTGNANGLATDSTEDEWLGSQVEAVSFIRIRSRREWQELSKLSESLL